MLYLNKLVFVSAGQISAQILTILHLAGDSYGSDANKAAHANTQIAVLVTSSCGSTSNTRLKTSVRGSG